MLEVFTLQALLIRRPESGFDSGVGLPSHHPKRSWVADNRHPLLSFPPPAHGPEGYCEWHQLPLKAPAAPSQFFLARLLRGTLIDECGKHLTQLFPGRNESLPRGRAMTISLPKVLMRLNRIAAC